MAASAAVAQPKAPVDAVPGGAPETLAAEKPKPDEALREIRRREEEENGRREMNERMRLVRLRLALQLRDNELWEREAIEKEADLVREAEDLFEEKDYREAKERYLDAIGISYSQWVFTDETMTFVRANKSWHTAKDFVPLCRRKLFPLSTEFTRLALVRMSDIDAAIDEYDLAGLRIEADRTFENGRLADAYRKYGDALEHARKMRGNAMALRYVQEIERKRDDLLAGARKPIEVARASLEAGEPAAALAALDEFRGRFGDFLFLGEFKRAYADLWERPEVQSQIQERGALQLVAQGDAAVAREDYQRAVLWYRRAAGRYPATRAGALAGEKREKLLADPAIVEAIARKEAEYLCKAMLARASTFAGWGKTAEAAAVYDKIIEEHPDTPWAKEAAEAKAKLAAPEPE